VTLGYADLKSLIVGSVDRVPDAADKTITGGRLNVSAAMTALEALLVQCGAVALSRPPSPVRRPPPPRPRPPPPVPSGPGVAILGAGGGVAAPVCGTSPLRGLNSAAQSSTVRGYGANAAIDGECKKKRLWQGSCARTSETSQHGSPQPESRFGPAAAAAPHSFGSCLLLLAMQMILNSACCPATSPNTHPPTD
jgi:hypothetical protein